MDSVLDVVQTPVYGKKGRMAVHVRVLTRPEAAAAVIAASLNQTSTLGVRHHNVQRTSLEREEGLASVQTHRGTKTIENAIRVKQVTRPDGYVTRKAEMDDLAQGDNSRAARERLRRTVETTHALADDNENDEQ